MYNVPVLARVIAYYYIMNSDEYTMYMYIIKKAATKNNSFKLLNGFNETAGMPILEQVFFVFNLQSQAMMNAGAMILRTDTSFVKHGLFQVRLLHQRLHYDNLKRAATVTFGSILESKPFYKVFCLFSCISLIFILF